MIDLHYWPATSGHNITRFRGAMASRCRGVPVNLAAGAQFTPGFAGTVSTHASLPRAAGTIPCGQGAR
jgi:hypothetical protein